MGKLPIYYIKDLLNSSASIPDERQKDLIQLKALIHQQIQQYGSSKLNFICTHNSRRSQLSELWLRIACQYFNLNKIQAFSGGTEATAFNHRMVAAIQSKGLPLQQISKNNNPIYSLDTDPLSPLMFSKVYDDKNNPEQAFIAVMVCDHAEQNCPLVHGADHRFSLKYIDPKYADDTPEESVAYQSKVDEIGREILFLAQQFAPLSS